MLIIATALSGIGCVLSMTSVERWADKAEPYRALRAAFEAAVCASILTQCVIALVS